MAGSQEGFSVLNLEEEQREKDKLIACLLEYKPATKEKPSSQKNSPKLQSTPVAATKSNRGRPPRNKQPVSSQSPSVIVSSSEQCNPSMELLISCIEKLNTQNKVLIDKVKELDAKVHKECSTVAIDQEQITRTSVNESTPQPPPETSAVLKSMSEKVDKIEESINSKLLICRGPMVSRKIASLTENSITDFGKLKAELCTDICGSEITKISVGSFGINLFGKDRSAVKIDCNNISVKKHLLQQARLRKPEGIYLTDFLSPYKRRIHNRLVVLKKEKPSLVKAVYVRGGVIYGKVGQETVKFESLEDVEKIDTVISASENTAESPRNSVSGSRGEEFTSGAASLTPLPPLENGDSN